MFKNWLFSKWQTWLLAIWLCACGLTIFMGAGCTTAMMDGFFAETVADSRGFHDIAAQRIAEHDDHMSEQHKAMHPEAAAEIDTLRADFAAKLATLQEQSDNNHSSVGTYLSEFADDLLAIVQQVTGMLIGFPENQTLAGFVDDEVVAGIKVSATATDELRADTDDKFAALIGELKDKLSAVSEATETRLEALKGDDAAFRAAIEQELRLSAAEMAQLEGMTTEQILALIAMAMASVAGGGLLGKTGKSRSATDISVINTKIAALEGKNSD